MNKFAQLQSEDRRLVILRLLSETPGFSANESLLQAALEDFGHSVSRDQVRTDLAWLAEQELIGIEEIGPLMVASSKARGLDAAAGRAIVPGVRRPSPRG